MLGVTRASASASASEGSGSGERVGDPEGASMSKPLALLLGAALCAALPLENEDMGDVKVSGRFLADEGSGSGERVGDPAGASGIGAGAPATPGRGQPSPSPGGAFFFVPPQARGAPEVTDGTGRR